MTLPVLASAYEVDAQAALRSLPDPLTITREGDACVAQISDDWYVLISPDLNEPPALASVIPDGDEWGVTFETLGQAVLRHFVREFHETAEYAPLAPGVNLESPSHTAGTLATDRLSVLDDWPRRDLVHAL